MHKIVAVIPTYNRKNHLRVILNQLLNQKSLGIYLLDIVVVVDGSTDGTIEMLANEFSKVHMITGSGNWWYTKSMNIGFRAC